MKRKSAVSSQREKFVQVSAADIKAFAKSPEAKAMARRAKAMGGPSKADLREIPEITDAEWAAIKLAHSKKSVTARIDGDVLAWLKRKPGKYQTNLNATLRMAMESERGVSTK